MYPKDKWTARGDESMKDHFRQITRKQGYVWESPAMIHSCFQEAKQNTNRAVCVCAGAGLWSLSSTQRVRGFRGRTRRSFAVTAGHSELNVGASGRGRRTASWQIRSFGITFVTKSWRRGTTESWGKRIGVTTDRVSRRVQETSGNRSQASEKSGNRVNRVASRRTTCTLGFRGTCICIVGARVSMAVEPQLFSRHCLRIWWVASTRGFFFFFRRSRVLLALTSRLSFSLSLCLPPSLTQPVTRVNVRAS